MFSCVQRVGTKISLSGVHNGHRTIHGVLEVVRGVDQLYGVEVYTVR